MRSSVSMDDISNMLKHGKYVVPRYQRGYAWVSTQVDQLWDDLCEAGKKDTHFFGIICIDRHDKIIDGQQRTTTVFLFLLAARDYIMAKDAKDGIIKEIEKYLFDGAQPKMVLSRLNDEYFQMLISDSHNVKSPPLELENDSNHNLYKAYSNLHKKVTQYGDRKGLYSVKKLIHNLRNFQVIEVTVANSSEAYSMFNLINNRGIPLSQFELIRSYIFGELEEHKNVNEVQIDGVDRKWSQIAKNIQKGANYDMDIFIQHILSFGNISIPDKDNNVTTEDTVSVKDIFNQLKKACPPDKILKWVDKAAEWSTVVKTLRKPSGNFHDQTGMTYDSERCIQMINRLGAVAVYPLLMVGFSKYWNKKDYASFDRLAKVCIKYHLRSKTIGKANVSKYQNELFRIARDCYKSDNDVNKIIDDLCKTSSYVSDEELKSLLGVFKPRSSAALILLELIEGRRSDTISHNMVTVEHIMPKTIDKWLKYICKIHDHCSEEYAIQIHQEYYGRLGNLTLLNKKPNSRLSNNNFEHKSKTYRRSNYQITKKVADTERWGKDQIVSRQKIFTTDLVEILDIKSLKTK